MKNDEIAFLLLNVLLIAIFFRAKVTKHWKDIDTKKCFVGNLLEQELEITSYLI
jgi:regulatory protein YycI of two-component signal transduction system YycFG